MATATHPARRPCAGRCRAGEGLSCRFEPHRPFCLIALPAAAVELGHVWAVHAAVAVVVEEPEETSLVLALPKTAQHQVEVVVIHIAVAVAVTEQPEEGVHAV